MGARGQTESLSENGTAGVGFLFGLFAGAILLLARYLADFGGFIELLAVAFSLHTSQVLMGRNYDGILVNVLFFGFEVLLPAAATSALAVVLVRISETPRNVAIGIAVGIVALLELATGLISLPIP